MPTGPKYIGIYPGNAIAFVRGLYKDKSEEYILNSLKNARPVPQTIPKKELIKQFASGNTIELNPSELLGIGIVGSYYTHTNIRGSTYQSMVRIEDSARSIKEALLSDGAIWENETRRHMIFQQTLVQDYAPESEVTTVRVIKAINDKAARKQRGDYPDNTGLIINIFSIHSCNVDLKQVIADSNLELFTSVFIIFYVVPTLEQAKIYLLKKDMSPPEVELNSQGYSLSQFVKAEPWRLNTIEE